MRAAGIEASVAAVLEEHPREGENRLDENPIAIGSISKLCEVRSIASLSGINEDLTAEGSGLRALVQLVGSAEVFEDGIEAVQQRGPVVEVTPREWPGRREGGEVFG